MARCTRQTFNLPTDCWLGYYNMTLEHETATTRRLSMCQEDCFEQHDFPNSVDD